MRFDLYSAEECFLTGTGAEVIGVTRIDGRVIGDGTVGPITQRLKEAFRRYVRGQEGETGVSVGAGAEAMAGR